MTDVAIIGAGAAGCFCAANLGRICPEANITIYEAARRPLAKVSVSGGGKCNLSNSFEDISLEKAYPRGARLMKRLLAAFGPAECMEWFTSRGVSLVTESDGRVFPSSQKSSSVTGALLGEIHKYGVRIKTGCRVASIEAKDKGYRLNIEEQPAVRADKVVVTVGGLSTAKSTKIFDGMGLTLEKPVPSLFTLKVPSPVTALSGISLPSVRLRLTGSKIESEGALLITDWGFSGPAVLKLSSYGARFLAENSYSATVSVCWLPESSEQELRSLLAGYIADHPGKSLASVHPEEIPGRLWTFILGLAGLDKEARYSSLGDKAISRLCARLLDSSFEIRGRARFKDEFVTCGGINLSEINPTSLESKAWKGLYFAGEVLDIDAITGGFNLQAAWSGGYCVAKAIASS